MPNLVSSLLATAALAATAGCGGESPTSGSSASAPPPAASSGQPSSAAAPARDARFPDVKAAKLTPTGDTYTLAVTVSNSSKRYADGWR